MDAREVDLERPPGPHGGRGLPALLLGALFVIRLVGIDQPIVENYVGRQVPTAMAARNLERGSGFFRPQLDTAPFPNYFVVEPPLYELGVVTLRRLTGLRIEEAGRALSAMMMTAAGWGLFDLLRRRAGRRVALFGLCAFAVLPITIRYGRAFQPEGAMLGTTLAGLAWWDRGESGGRRSRLIAGWFLLALGFAIKIIAAFLLIPWILAVLRTRRTSRVVLACTAVVPAMLWYTWANHLVGAGVGSQASADNRAIWLGLVVPSALLRPEAWGWIVRFAIVRAFTPLGTVLALWGLTHRRGFAEHGRRLWWIWGLSASIVLAVLAQKLHHEYYFLILAPAAAAGIGYALDDLAATGRARGYGTLAALVLLGMLQAGSTWRLPEEWRDLIAASRAVAVATPADAWIVAPEALLFQSDRRGCRLEWTPSAARRAAGEWGAGAEVESPLELLECYRRRGARYFADLGDARTDRRRMALHDQVRRRYKVIVDRPEVIIADLVAAEMNPHAN
jgi:4-amino-4-deoxy-L-arabinose transferase-like glycosyltransferase